MDVYFTSRQELAPGIWQYGFRPERPVDFEPGQYVDLHLNSVAGDRRGNKRTFSITSLPSDPLLSFVLKHFALQSPYKQVLQALQPGDVARIGDAMGDLVLPKLPTIPLVFVAGGIGVASYASMLGYLLQQKEERQIFLFYRVRAARERIYKPLTDSYPLQLNQTVLAPNDIQAREILATTPPDALIYISGSQTFVETLRTDLERLDVHRSRIVFDYYDGYAEL